jgi:hypothetical protein
LYIPQRKQLWEIKMTVGFSSNCRRSLYNSNDCLLNNDGLVGQKFRIRCCRIFCLAVICVLSPTSSEITLRAARQFRNRFPLLRGSGMAPRPTPITELMASLTALIGHPATGAIVYDICLSVRTSKWSNGAFIWLHTLILTWSAWLLLRGDVTNTFKNFNVDLQIENNCKKCCKLSQQQASSR